MFFGSLPRKDLLPKILTDTYDKFELEGESYLNNFHRLFNTNPIDENIILNYISKSPDIAMLLKLSFIDEKLAAWCKDARLSTFWNNVWQATHESRKPQKYISSYQLLCGLTLYNEAFHLIDNGFAKESSDVMQLMTQASNLGFFDALIFVFNIYECKLIDGKIENPAEIISPFLNAAPWHGTPVFLLCAISYFRIGEYYAILDNLNDSKSAYQNALTYIYLAKFFEQESHDAINNAYYGQGIINSNPWEISTINELILHLIKFSGLDTIAQSRALYTANQLARNFIPLFHEQENIQAIEKNNLNLVFARFIN